MQDEKGRLWDVLWMAYLAARQHPDESSFEYEVLRIDRNVAPASGDTPSPTLVQLVATLSGGDDGEVVLTIHFEGED